LLIGGLDVTSTPSKTAWFRVTWSWLVTAKPANRSRCSGPASDDAIATQLRPSADWNAVNWPAARSSFSQGIVTIAGAPATNTMSPPEADRTMNSSPPSGFTSRIAPAEPGSTLVRSMTPALANG